MREKTFGGRPEGNFRIEDIRNGKCRVLFFENIEEKEDEVESGIYEYDLYEIEVVYRENLEESIAGDYDKWLRFAKERDYEKVAREVRQKRDKLLKETDWTQMPDNSVLNTMLERYQAYRQALRDVPQQEGFPYDVVFPRMKGE